MNYVRLYDSELLIKIFTEDRTAYISTLNETEDLTVFRGFIQKQHSKFLSAEIEK